MRKFEMELKDWGITNGINVLGMLGISIADFERLASALFVISLAAFNIYKVLQSFRNYKNEKEKNS